MTYLIDDVLDEIKTTLEASGKKYNQNNQEKIAEDEFVVQVDDVTLEPETVGGLRYTMYVTIIVKFQTRDTTEIPETIIWLMQQLDPQLRANTSVLSLEFMSPEIEYEGRKKHVTLPITYREVISLG